MDCIQITALFKIVAGLLNDGLWVLTEPNFTPIHLFRISTHNTIDKSECVTFDYKTDFLTFNRYFQCLIASNQRYFFHKILYSLFYACSELFSKCAISFTDKCSRVKCLMYTFVDFGVNFLTSYSEVKWHPL